MLLLLALATALTFVALAGAFVLDGAPQR